MTKGVTFNPRRIVVARAERGWSQEDLGRRMGFKAAREMVSRWERGAAQPSLEQLERMAGVCGVSIGFFFTGGMDDGGREKTGTER